jgi:ectoine hydroxylase-related dioxygenase (phytanoyl-CoA dioxygenase family)
MFDPAALGHPYRSMTIEAERDTRWEIRRGVVDPGAVQDALRVLHLDLLTHGADAGRLSQWLWAAHWFPHLRDDPAILALARALPAEWRTGEPCEPQILLQFPHTGPEPEVTFHVDQEPAWAAGRPYRRIVGVALSPWRAENGGLMVVADTTPVALELDAGDAVMMAPELPHSGGINRTGAIRYGVYFRWLEDAAPAPSTASSSP